MIIDITKSGYQKGYLPKTGVGVFHPFFATANAAFRREALLRTGGFDPRCETGEDIDVSIRVARAGYELWFEPAARILHTHRNTLRGLLRQWFHYGYGHPYLFKKHSPRRRLQVFRYDLSTDDENPFGIRCILSLPSPIYGMVFLSSFHLMHLALAVALVALLVSAKTVALAALGIGVLTALWYASLRFDPRRPLKSLALTGIRYMADGAYVLGGLLGGLRERMLCLEATRTRRK